jgi:hypothetical protein
MPYSMKAGRDVQRYHNVGSYVRALEQPLVFDQHTPTHHLQQKLCRQRRTCTIGNFGRLANLVRKISALSGMRLDPTHTLVEPSSSRCGIISCMPLIKIASLEMQNSCSMKKAHSLVFAQNPALCMFGSGNGDDKFRDANNFWKLRVTDNDCSIRMTQQVDAVVETTGPRLLLKPRNQELWSDHAILSPSS